MAEEKIVNAEETASEEIEVNTETAEKTEKTEKKDKKSSKKELDALKKEVEELKKAVEEKNEMFLRMAAEYENYRKRTAKEKEGLYGDAYIDAVTQLLPILDNLERAVAFSESGNLAEGVNLTLNMFKDTFTKMGVEEIVTENAEFDPNLHNAVMHIDDESFGENMIVETFSKGYKRGDKVIRYAMVKVAN
ncbi:MAG: nucleotide exchange factor GrpE [Clostridia bacterium]|nr:nucleotide exchange factor GrpE [Clostridia bacterium]